MDVIDNVATSATQGHLLLPREQTTLLTLWRGEGAHWPVQHWFSNTGTCITRPLQLCEDLAQSSVPACQQNCHYVPDLGLDWSRPASVAAAIVTCQNLRAIFQTAQYRKYCRIVQSRPRWQFDGRGYTFCVGRIQLFSMSCTYHLDVVPPWECVPARRDGSRVEM